MHREFDMLNMDSFKRTIDSLPKGSYITLTGNGEPTINVHIYEMISYASQKGMFSSIITNGSTLNEENRKRLINSGISRVQFSFESLDKETNENIMRGSFFERDIMNILKTILEIRKEKKKIYLSISRVKIEESEKYAKVSKQFWEKIPIDNYYEGPLLSLQDDSAMFQSRENEIHYLPCANPWTDVKISATGDIVACIQDFSSKYCLGNINDQPLMEILNSEKAILFRKAMLTGDWAYLDSVGYSGCKKCNTWTEEVNGNIYGMMECSLPIRMGLVINEISGDRPENTEFLEKAIDVLESGETDLIHALMDGENDE